MSRWKEPTLEWKLAVKQRRKYARRRRRLKGFSKTVVVSGAVAPEFVERMLMMGVAVVVRSG